MLSEMNADKLALAVAAGDVKAITKANGVGKKIAERIVLELKDKMAGISLSGEDSGIAAAASVTPSETHPGCPNHVAYHSMGFCACQEE